MEKQSAKIELLYFGHGHSSGAPLHSHPYYQLEYCIAGELITFNGKSTRRLSHGDFWLISPGEKHLFKKNQKEVDYISIKFNSNQKYASCVSSSPIGQFYLDEICKIIDGENRFTAYSIEGKVVLEHLLSGLLEILSKDFTSASLSDFEWQLQKIIYNMGASVSVNDLAESFRISRAEFKYRFKKETGNSYIKKFIDKYLLKISEEQLKFSDISIQKIAEELHFSSIYAFSRYFKQHKGISPAAFRNSYKLPARVKL